ncbi:MAG: protoporphyrinogen oxidase [Thermodesulfobacteriota bacterium]|nr:protoporphyrinogen oxidase [Thermodesulfobacteriota bacterium]
MTRIVIIGAGISGLATAYALEQAASAEQRDLQIIVIEKQAHCGGKIWSRREDGYLCEWGPNGFLDNKPATLDLCKSLTIDNDLVRSNDNARKRFIFSDNTLHRLPENGAMFFSSKLLSWSGKLRLLGELAVAAKKDNRDETLAEFGRRRLGAEALDKLIAPMAGGIFAGDPETMSVKSCFPRIVELEQQYGGLLKAMIKMARQKRRERKAGKQVASAAGPGGILTSFAGGIQQLTDSLTPALKADICTGLSVESIEYADHYLLALSDGSQIEADVVVSAAPANALAPMLQNLNAEAASLLNKIPYAAMNVVCFGYDRDQLACNVDGFGYLIPRKEGCSVLGTLWDSSIFTQRAPEGKVLLRSMMGGATRPKAAELNDDQVQALVQADLERIMGITVDPEFMRIFRHQYAIPQYVSGHAALVKQLRSELSVLPGLFITGNAYDGIGLNDCVKNAQVTARQALEFIAQK